MLKGMKMDKACHIEIDSSAYSLRKFVDNSVEKNNRARVNDLSHFSSEGSESPINSMFYNI
jgi:hypothetical protein